MDTVCFQTTRKGNRNLANRKSNPTLSPDRIVLQIAPGNDLRVFREHGFDFNPLNWIGGQLRLDHLADQEVFLFGHGLDGSPFAQQQLFGVQGVHQVLVVV